MRRKGRVMGWHMVREAVERKDEAQLAQEERRSRRRLHRQHARESLDNPVRDAAAFQRDYKRVKEARDIHSLSKQDALAEQCRLMQHCWNRLVAERRSKVGVIRRQEIDSRSGGEKAYGGA